MPQTKERLLHHVIVSVFCKAYERQEEVLAGLDTISPIPTAELLKLDKEFDPDRPRTYHYRGKDVTLTVHPGTGHAFMAPHNALGTRNEKVAAEIWPQMISFLKKHVV